MYWGKKFSFLVENGPSLSLENLSTYLSIFYNFESLASFSHHFWIKQRKLQPMINNGIISIIETKSSLCG